MVISLRKCLTFIRFAIIFLALTYLLFRMLSAFGDLISPVDPYRIPQGYAVKAFQLETRESDVAMSMGERLRIFYWYGE
ncbi:DUF4227 family protein [Paenibacillus sp. FA6]|uniref:DUF4227 family protein n=1 Tax=Paenibacillus sp. FA6 TaxID=3413029 RepID=UPI003F6604FE